MEEEEEKEEKDDNDDDEYMENACCGSGELPFYYLLENWRFFCWVYAIRQVSI